MKKNILSIGILLVSLFMFINIDEVKGLETIQTCYGSEKVGKKYANVKFDVYDNSKTAKNKDVYYGVSENTGEVGYSKNIENWSKAVGGFKGISNFDATNSKIYDCPKYAIFKYKGVGSKSIYIANTDEQLNSIKKSKIKTGSNWVTIKLNSTVTTTTDSNGNTTTVANKTLEGCAGADSYNYSEKCDGHYTFRFSQKTPSKAGGSVTLKYTLNKNKSNPDGNYCYYDGTGVDNKNLYATASGDGKKFIVKFYNSKYDTILTVGDLNYQKTNGSINGTLTTNAYYAYDGIASSISEKDGLKTYIWGVDLQSDSNNRWYMFKKNKKNKCYKFLYIDVTFPKDLAGSNASNFDNGLDDRESDESNLVDPDYEELSEGCAIIGTGDTYKTLKWILNLIRFAAPILVIILGVSSFVGAVFSGEEKSLNEAKDKFIKRLVAAIVLILIPFVIKFLVDITGIIFDLGIEANDIFCGLI